VNVDEFVAQHNRNAEKINTLVAKPSVSVDARLVGMTDFAGGTEGRLAMERPQNFKLMLEAAGTKKVADIGSNDQEFWFWVPNDRDRSIYWCNYSDLDRKGVAVPFQPDWIVESMGLKIISSEEASQIKPTPGPEAGTTALVFPPTQVGGETYHRTVVVDNRDRRIKLTRILAADKRTVVLEATLSNYHDYDLPEPNRTGDTCFLADSVRLHWKRDRIAFDVKMKDVEINQLSATQSAAIFVEPKIPNYVRRNLAEMNRGSEREPRMNVRRTIPQPEPRRSANADKPGANSGDAPVVPRLGQLGTFQPGRPAPRNASNATSNLDGLPPLPADDLVGAPTASVPAATDARTAGIMGSQGSNFAVER
jgi:hypothetical protein